MDTTISGGVPPRDVKLWDEVGHEHDMMSTRLLGFWLYMLGDSLIFAALFAAYEVLAYQTGMQVGPSPHDVAKPVYAYIETVLLFTSVLAYGIGMVSLKNGHNRALAVWIGVAFVIGLGFLGMEWRELARLAAEGNTPQRSGYLSIFYALVVVHGIHIAFGLLWMIVMQVQLATKGITDAVLYRLANLKIFWLYQALIWTFLYTFVYVRGSI